MWRFTIPFLFIVLCSGVLILAIDAGFRMPIDKAPFVVWGRVQSNNVDSRFGGILIDERHVLTMEDVCKTHMTKHEMVVGVHNIWKPTEVQRYRIKRFERGNALCLLQLTTRVTINGHVQRAILPTATEPFPHHRSFLYVAGFGRTTTFDFADELHYRPVYVDRRSDGLTVLMAEHNWKFKLEVADQGSAVWNPETGVIFCLVKLPIENKYHPCEELARQRLWIEDTRKRLTNFSHYEN